ncbi:MAG TPA: VOC family protein, partial [Gammaproteobacteria bacterium]|nr:VOC family protein [Gammaproteobacteria bacterium]
MTQLINWFEILTVAFERAVDFYQKAFGVALKREEMNGRRMGIFPREPSATSGCVCEALAAQPGRNGPLIYLDGRGDLAVLLSQVEALG